MYEKYSMTLTTNATDEMSSKGFRRRLGRVGVLCGIVVIAAMLSILVRLVLSCLELSKGTAFDHSLLDNAFDVGSAILCIVCLGTSAVFMRASSRALELDADGTALREPSLADILLPILLGLVVSIAMSRSGHLTHSVLFPRTYLRLLFGNATKVDPEYEAAEQFISDQEACSWLLLVLYLSAGLTLSIVGVQLARIASRMSSLRDQRMQDTMAKTSRHMLLLVCLVCTVSLGESRLGWQILSYAQSPDFGLSGLKAAGVYWGPNYAVQAILGMALIAWPVLLLASVFCLFARIPNASMISATIFGVCCVTQVIFACCFGDFPDMWKRSIDRGLRDSMTKAESDMYGKLQDAPPIGVSCAVSSALLFGGSLFLNWEVATQLFGFSREQKERTSPASDSLIASPRTPGRSYLSDSDQEHVAAKSRDDTYERDKQRGSFPCQE